MPETATEWLEELFEFELCHDCGGDALDHDVVQFTLGYYGGPYYFAKCKDETWKLV